MPILEARKDFLHDPLYVVAVVSNPVRYLSRYELYHRFEKHMEDSGAILYTVEAAYGERDHAVTKSDNPRHIQLRTNTELWHKENLINIGVSRLPNNWKYVAWIDADVIFARHDWVTETLHQLQHYPIVQLFSQAADLNTKFEPYDSEKGIVQHSFAGSYHKYVKAGCPADLYPCFGRKNNRVSVQLTDYMSEYWHSGFGWAIRRDAWDGIGGLIDWSGLGSADHMMAWGMIGHMDIAMYRSVHPNFREWAMNWAALAERHIRRKIGCVDGLVTHHFHGPKKKRGYVSRWDVIVQNQFDPAKDIKRDWQGLFQLVDHGDMRSLRLRDGIMHYFRQRSEDESFSYE